MGPGSLLLASDLFLLHGANGRTREKRQPPCLPRPGTPGAKPEQRIDPNDAGQCESLAAPLRSRRSPLGVSCTGGPGASPRRLFGPFLDVQKGTRPAGRAPPALEKGQAIVVHLHLPSAPTGQLHLDLSGSAAFPLP